MKNYLGKTMILLAVFEVDKTLDGQVDKFLI